MKMYEIISYYILAIILINYYVNDGRKKAVQLFTQL